MAIAGPHNKKKNLPPHVLKKRSELTKPLIGKFLEMMLLDAHF